MAAIRPLGTTPRAWRGPAARGSSSIAGTVATARRAGTSVSPSGAGPSKIPKASPKPKTASAATLAALLSRKNAIDRAAIFCALMPRCESTHAPSASPPAPPDGSSADVPTSDIPIRELIRHATPGQNTG